MRPTNRGKRQRATLGQRDEDKMSKDETKKRDETPRNPYGEKPNKL